MAAIASSLAMTYATRLLIRIIYASSNLACVYTGTALDANNQYVPAQETLIAPGMTEYPNPSTGMFEPRMDEGAVCERAEIFNAAGQLIWQETTSSSLLNFDLSDQLAGCYYLRVQSGGAVQVLKLLVLR